MSVFGNYAHYYDLLYKDKDYSGEAEYTVSLLNSYAPDASSILELGCGTGSHAVNFASMGYKVTGIDMSESMLEQAKMRKKKLAADVSARLDFEHGDIRSFRAGDTFDVVLALFHVFSYQRTNHDLHAVFQTAASHLGPGGVLIFDCWYGPAVLSQLPEVRIKRLEDDTLRVIRIAEPEMNPNENSITVNYQVFVWDKSTGEVSEIREKHCMRYLFYPEVEKLLADVGMTLLAAEEWMSGREPGLDTWGVCFVAKKLG